ncbi:MAG: HAMP domain-containing sensor histidine kinase [Candidatus Saccharibacteria bacterium]|nr:HAMP domain-containing sensor histidine kinase [Candidatus Saccharibacteria bacterium]
MEKEVENILLVAHELKAPLAVLRQLALSFDFETPTNEHIRSEMVSVSERAIRQVNDLSKIARLEDGLFAMEPVSVRAVCDDVTRELNYLFRYNQRDLYVKYKNHARLVTANRDLLYSVVYNFLLNAMHYSGKDTRSELIVNEKAGKIRISIRDFGPALPMDVWREMRRGWVNKPTSIAMRPGSSGLGLYIASKFSRYMNANVGAIRHRDGTSFFVDLPVSTQARLF